MAKTIIITTFLPNDQLNHNKDKNRSSDKTTKMVSSRTALVLYGSETGNAQDVAEEIGKLLRRLHFKVRVTEMNAVQLVSFQRNSAVRPAA